jgi:hypothetical protein
MIKMLDCRPFHLRDKRRGRVTSLTGCDVNWELYYTDRLLKVKCVNTDCSIMIIT